MFDMSPARVFVFFFLLFNYVVFTCTCSFLCFFVSVCLFFCFSHCLDFLLFASEELVGRVIG